MDTNYEAVVSMCLRWSINELYECDLCCLECCFQQKSWSNTHGPRKKSFRKKFSPSINAFEFALGNVLCERNFTKRMESEESFSIAKNHTSGMASFRFPETHGNTAKNASKRCSRGFQKWFYFISLHRAMRNTKF